MELLLILVMLAVAIWVKVEYPKWKGQVGETFVAKQLSVLDPNHYKILNNLLLPSLGSTNTTQIDHVVVSNYGIFCIETKDYSYWVFGRAHEAFWMQIIYHARYKIYNPLRQNYVHVKALEALIRPLFPKVPIIPFVVFPSAEKLKISGTNSVGTTRQIIYKIKAYNTPALSDQEKDQICGILTKANIQDKKAIKQHNKEIKILNGY